MRGTHERPYLDVYLLLVETLASNYDREVA
jgi:hypothetical protein